MKRSADATAKQYGGKWQRMRMEEDELHTRGTSRHSLVPPLPGTHTSTSSGHGSSHSKVATMLVRDVLWGSLPAAEASRYARAVVADGSTHPDVLKLSKLGAKGFCKNNTWRDMKRKMKRSRFHAALGKCRAVAKHGPTETKAIDIPILYPHILLATMYHHYYDKFTE